MAEWKPFDLTWGRSIYYCTECKEGIEVPTSCGKPMYKFCPMCGARMDTADTPQTDYLVKAPHKSRESHEIDTPQTDCDTCRHYKLACELFSEVCKYEPTTQTETKNSNLTFDISQTDCGWSKPNE